MELRRCVYLQHVAALARMFQLYQRSVGPAIRRARMSAI